MAIEGISIGSAEDARARTGVSVILADPACVAAIDVRGGGPGTRETDLLAPGRLVDRIDAIVLSGGSVFGLDAASAVVRWLAARGRGFPAGPARCPIAPAAVLFDLANGGDKDADEPPYARLAVEACEAATPGPPRTGKAGAGYGATAGAYEGGLGWAEAVVRWRGAAWTVAALAAVNSAGSPVIPGCDSLWAWPFEQEGEMGWQPAPTARGVSGLDLAKGFGAGANTTLIVVMTDAPLDKARASRLAVAAHDGLARAIRPAHLPIDGDVAFAMATGEGPELGDAAFALAALCDGAADVVARAIGKGVYEARSLGDHPSYRDRHASALGRP